MRRVFTVLVVLTLLGNKAKSQDINVKDRAEITYRAEVLISEFENLLNIIANSDISSFETNELMKNSYSNSKNKIFLNANAVLEDDIQPSNINNQSAEDATVDKYLRDFDLLYSKSPEPAVIFSEIKTSALKKKDYLFVKVYFESQFTNLHKELKQPYQKTRRVAEIRADKENNQWNVQIVSITFYDPSNPIDGEDGNVQLAEAPSANGEDASATNDSGMVEAVVRQETKKLFAEYKMKRDSAFNDALKKGEQAISEKKYLEAIQFFTDAQEINPYDVSPKLKINEITRAIIDEKNNEKASYDNLVKNGEKSMSIRDYSGAKKYFQQALSAKPGDVALQTKVKELDLVIRSKVQLESKFIAGDYAGAIKDYTKVIKNNKKNPDYYFGRGKCYYKLKNVSKALNDYTEAIELDINFLEALETRALLYLELNDFYKALGDYTVMISNNPDDSKYLQKRAGVKVLLNDLKGAISDYEEAIKIHPKTANYQYEKGLLQYRLLSWNESELSMAAAIRIDSSQANFHYSHGLALIAQNKVKEASESFNKAKARKLNDSFIKNIDAIAYLFYNKGVEFYSKKDFNKAIAEFNNALALKPDFGEAFLSKGDACFELKNFKSAIENYKYALKWNDKLFMAYFKQSLCNYIQQDYELSVENAMKAESLNKDFFQAILQQGKAHFQLQKFQDAIFHLGRAKAKNVDDFEIYWFLGKSFNAVRNFSQALSELNSAVKKTEATGEVFFDRGVAKFGLKSNKDAIKDFAKSIELGYKTSQAYYYYGNALKEDGQIEEAAKNYSTAIEKDDEFPDVFYQRGKCFNIQKKYDLALKDYFTASSLDGNLNKNVLFLKEKGFIQLSQSLSSDAILTFSSILEIDKNMGLAWYGKACAVLQKNQMEDALKYFDEAFKTKTLTWNDIKKDSYIQTIINNKDFKELKKKYF